MIIYACTVYSMQSQQWRFWPESWIQEGSTLRRVSFSDATDTREVEAAREEFGGMQAEAVRNKPKACFPRHRLSIAYCSPWKSWPSKCKVQLPSVATVLFGCPCLWAWHFKHVPLAVLASATLALFPVTRISFVLPLAGKAGSAGVWNLVTFLSQLSWSQRCLNRSNLWQRKLQE